MVYENALQHLQTADPILARVIAQVGACRLRPDRRQSPFAALVEAVVHQQLTGKAAQTILGRVKALHAQKPFPAPEDLLGTSEADLRAAGLSRAKAAALKDISAKTLDGVIPNARALARLDDDEIVERLTTLRGVGRWTVEMLLIFKLGRLDVLPVNDYGVRKGFAVTYRKRALPTPAALLAHGERWRPYRSVASWYLWRALDLERKPKEK
jgi:3-methyladenine DNA glycosylase/8-oxoguanine DNA glycosylase